MLNYAGENQCSATHEAARATLAPPMDLSCRTTRIVFEAAEAAGIPRARLVEGLDFDLGHLADPRHRFSWDILVTVFERLSTLLDGDADRIRGVGGHVIRVPSFDFIQKAAQSLLSLRSVYEMGNRWLAPALFPHVPLTMEYLSPRRVRFTIELPERYLGCVPFFYLVQGNLREVPRLLGLPAATIDSSTVTSRGSVTIFALPPSLSLLQRARRSVVAVATSHRAVALLEQQRVEIEQGFEASRRLSDELRGLLERLPDSVLIHRGGTILWTNRVLLTTLGYERAHDLVGKPLLDIVDDASSETVRTRMGTPTDAMVPEHTEAILRRQNGERVIMEVSPTQTVSFGGAEARLLVGRDVTERARMQASLVTSERMTSLGMLAAGVAHEINNPLTYVLASIEVARLDIEQLEAPPARAREALAMALEGIGRVRAIVGDLRTMSREDGQAVLPIDVRATLESTLALAKSQIAGRAHIVRDYEPTPLAAGSAARLGQVFLNLIVNALEAMPNDSPNTNALCLRTRTTKDGKAVVEVSDNGAGIAPKALGRVFDPFFTTKPVGQGTGLGLAICRQIIAELGGEISVESTVGRGTTFRVTLPAAGPDEADTTSAKEAAPVRRAHKRARVLAIDDEPRLLESVRFVLSMHDVAVAGSARAALDILARDDAFDVILCDLMMPEQTGMDLHADLEKFHPQLCERLVFMTGGAFTSRAREFLTRVPNRVIDKPFTAQELVASIEHHSARRPA